VLSKLRKEQRKTRGGQKPKTPSQGTIKILELLKDTPSFSGLQAKDLKEIGEEKTLFSFENNRLSCDWQRALFLAKICSVN